MEFTKTRFRGLGEVSSPRCLFGGHRETTGSANGGRHRGGRTSRGRTAVVGHMSPDEMSGGESSAQAELTSENRGSDDARQLASILTRGGGVRATDTKEIQHGALSLQDGTTTDGTDLDTGHGNCDLEVTVDTGRG